LVQNLSKAGAKLALEKAADLPDVFTLNFSHRGVHVTYQARVKWWTPTRGSNLLRRRSQKLSRCMAARPREPADVL
jgi:hypothetical protein